MEEFVTYEQAKLLKELGFNWECDHWYHPDDKNRFYESRYDNHNKFEKPYSAPTYSQVHRWLMDVKRIVIGIIPSYDIQDNGTYDWRYWYKIYLSSGQLLWSEVSETYEHALECAIEDTLWLIKKGKNDDIRM